MKIVVLTLGSSLSVKYVRLLILMCLSLKGGSITLLMLNYRIRGIFCGWSH